MVTTNVTAVFHTDTKPHTVKCCESCSALTGSKFSIMIKLVNFLNIYNYGLQSFCEHFLSTKIHVCTPPRLNKLTFTTPHPTNPPLPQTPFLHPLTLFLILCHHSHPHPIHPYQPHPTWVTLSTFLTHQVFTKLTNSGENCASLPRLGASPFTTCVSCSKTFVHFGYGNRPVATSICSDKTYCQ